MLKQMRNQYENELANLRPLHTQLYEQEKKLFTIVEQEVTDETMDNYEKVWKQYHKVDDIVDTLEELIYQLDKAIETQENLQMFQKRLDKVNEI